MRMRRMPSHPVFRLEGRSRHFQSFWELELTPGEETAPHQHYESEEIIYLVQGSGAVRLAETERVVAPGEVVLVPPRTDHVIANRSDRLLRAITVESSLDLSAPEAGPVVAELTVSPEELRLEEQARESLRDIGGLMSALPGEVDEASAIRAIVDLFDIGGAMAEQVEHELGLDNTAGREALARVERRIMHAVIEITGRYRGQGWSFG